MQKQKEGNHQKHYIEFITGYSVLPQKHAKTHAEPIYRGAKKPFQHNRARTNMTKQVILITGTPCTGKTTTSHALTTKLNALHINLTQLATTQNLTLGKDKKRNTTIIDEKRMKQKLTQIINKSTNKTIIIDGHYAVNVVPKQLISYVFVLRRNPVELRKIMEKCGFKNNKLWENLASEILDVCLVDALNVHKTGKVCEIDTTDKSSKEVTNEILAVLADPTKCCVGIVDWLGKLEQENLLDEYLKI
jgi:adenylate kinase